MADLTCAICGAPFIPKTKRSKCCSTACSKKYGRDRPGTECSVDGCTRPVRAKGLCSTDYNKIHCPDRHRFEFECACCGTHHVTKRSGGKYCSETCYVYATYGPAKCDLNVGTCDRCGAAFALRFSQRGHCSAACREAAAKDRQRARLRARPKYVPVERVTVECVCCAKVFESNQKTATVCSPKCRRRKSKLARRVAEAGSYGEYRWSDFVRIAAKFGGRCAYCEEPSDRLDPDHVVPLSKGGPNTVSNLLPACPSCNSDKQALSLDAWAASREMRHLWPLKTSWHVSDSRYHHLTSARGEDGQTDAACVVQAGHTPPGCP